MVSDVSEVCGVFLFNTEQQLIDLEGEGTTIFRNVGSHS